ncbi:MAG: hypothetical protein RMM98_06295 [Acidobacteriota bacterium]|nr:hypothetical protein [Blastocatellia bacterium]MDW8239208.1 hypothetical protein [Acidobacteriota bacterium]
MEEKEWTIDTYVLYKAADVEWSAIMFLGNVRKRHKVAFDLEAHIEIEYRTCIETTQTQNKPGSELIKRWFADVVAKKARIFHSGKLPVKHEKALRELGFDDDDLPFVAVCRRTTSRLLVSEDSDYTDAIKDYLVQKMGIRVLTIAEAEEESAQ